MDPPQAGPASLMCHIFTLSTQSVTLTCRHCAQGRLSVADALEAARVEEDFQIEEWGLVEGGHDIDIADARARVAAPAVFVRLLEYQMDRPIAV